MSFGPISSARVVEVWIMSAWLDTETKALLQHVPPEKYAPPDTGTFTLVLLKKRASNTTHVARLLARIPGVSNGW